MPFENLKLSLYESEGSLSGIRTQFSFVDTATNSSLSIFNTNIWEAKSMNRVASLTVIIGLALFLVVSCGPRKTKEQLYAEAQQFEKQEDFKGAIKVYEQLIKDYPESQTADSILFRIGQIYSNNLADFENAIKVHQRLIEKYPDSKISAQSLFMIGYHYANSINDTAQARKYYEKFLEKYPDHVLASSVQWELDHLGQDINEIDFLKSGATENADNNTGSAPQSKNAN